ncbi:MAG TPA: class D sortase [Terriglobia bacterium]|nr:class D sortase [Terriglobia bacterium]
MRLKKWVLFRSERARSAFRWCRYPFLIVGLWALGYCGYVLLDAKAFQAYETWRFERAVKNFKASQAQGKDLYPSPNPPLSAETNSIKAGSAASAASAGFPLGQLEISSIGLSVMIIEGIDRKTLRRAVGHIPGTSLPGEQGNVGIAGHRDTFFRPLRNIHRDDVITLTTLKGVYRYRVDTTELVEPEDMSVLNKSDEAILTLVTCFPFYYVGPAPKRFIVRAVGIPEGQDSKLVSEPPPKLVSTPDPR